MDIQELDFWIEITDTNKHGIPPVLVSLDDSDKNVGFRSVYAYSTDTAKIIMSNRSVSGLVNNPDIKYYSDTLFVDFDDNEESAVQFEDLLIELGVGYKAYDSGNRSIHFHVSIEPMYDRSVPYSQKKYMQQLLDIYGIDADRSIYQPVGLYRLEGTIHKKTGKSKTLIREKEGNQLSIPLSENTHVSTAPESRQETFEQLWRLLLTTVSAGEGRHFHAWKIVDKLKDLSLESDIDKYLGFWNKNYCKPALNRKELRSRG